MGQAEFANHWWRTGSRRMTVDVIHWWCAGSSRSTVDVDHWWRTVVQQADLRYGSMSIATNAARSMCIHRQLID